MRANWISTLIFLEVHLFQLLILSFQEVIVTECLIGEFGPV